VQELFDSDPLCYKGNVRARMGYEMMRAAEDGRNRAAELRLPLLVMYGVEDKLVNPSGAKLLYERASSADKTIKAWDDCRHEIFNEPEQAEVIAFMADWLDAHAAPQSQPALSSAVAA
jgi:alpha-beta hydrolase superfamily lysophospholipase